MIKGVLFMADEMLAAGEKELQATPDEENPLETVARIYTAMEIARVIIEHMLEQAHMTPEEKAKKLN